MLGLNRADSWETVVDSAVLGRNAVLSFCWASLRRPTVGPPTPPMASQAATTTRT